MQQTTDNGQLIAGNGLLKTTDNGQRTADNGRIIVIFFLALIAFYFYGIGSIPFVGPDEPRYAQVAREMLMRGDLVTPTLGGHTWFEKPALLYWMLMGGFAAFGVSEWAARFGPACAGLLTILAVYWMGRRVELACDDDGAARSDETKRTSFPHGLGLWSALSLASSAGLMIFSRAVSFDVIVTWTMTVALACFFVSELERDEKRRRWLLVAFYAGVGASLLAKGLIGVVIPGGIIGAYFLLQRKWPERRLMKSLLWGVPLALVVASLWYGPVIQRNGWKFVDEFFIQHHFARYVSNKYHHPGPFYYYLPALLILALPWPVFLVSALIKARRWNWREPCALSRFHLFTLAWLVVPVAFFSVSGSKLPGYILPALPAAALLVGERLSRIVQGEGSALAIRLTGLLLLAFCVGGVFYARQTAYTSTTCAAVVLGPLFIAGLLTLTLAHLRRLCLVATAVAALLSLALAVNCVAGVIARRESTRELLQQARERGFGAAPVGGLYVIERTAEFYAAERVLRGPDGEVVRFEGAQEVLESARRGSGPILVFVPLDAIWQLTEYSSLTTEIIGDNGTVALIAAGAKE